jgi:hypothetical protein
MLFFFNFSVTGTMSGALYKLKIPNSSTSRSQHITINAEKNLLFLTLLTCEINSMVFKI